ncbi:hydroxymethylglutaryl-CoA lyase [Acidaminococcus sp. BV3L6]|uniref:hydroxymethylglutaryl-CoA lyase n=1 Tax=Acidaminococcus sp. (strain BV3L6) TaxID=1111120 RepID=UPI0003AE6FF2|nr:hydroxymethylglutaryl-CoA lyase [Acidaminococcus sp. BV3L6]ERL15874.1 HMGL-like protein [Acidaminococcus sp. BV3L6]
MALPKVIELMEVCPRDGWQNYPIHISKENKIKYIKKMIDYGAKRIDVTSFVNPKYVPQMDDSAEVVAGTLEYAKKHSCVLDGLTLNTKGVENAIKAGLTDVTFVLSASEEHNLRNSRRTMEESKAAFLKLLENASNLNVTLAMPCIFGFPFGDEIDMKRIRGIIEEAFAYGVKKVGLADTAGISTPAHTRAVLREMKTYLDPDQVSIHIHDTYGYGMANVYVALEEGFTKFDAALCGMGGCPFAPGAKGNVATEDLVHMCHEMGVATGYDLEAVMNVGVEMAEEIDAVPTSSMLHACGYREK